MPLPVGRLVASSVVARSRHPRCCTHGAEHERHSIEPMALLYDAVLTPSKLELIESWLSMQPWFVGETVLESVAAYRFDDPEDTVGIETIIVASDAGTVYQAALTYRGAALVGAEKWLIGTMEHSVLGHRFIYDATGDPVYLAALATTIRFRGHQAELIVDTNGTRVLRAPTALVSGTHPAGASGTIEGADATAAVSPPPVESIRTRHEHGITYIDADDLHLAVCHVLPPSAPAGSVAGSTETGSTVAGSTVAGRTVTGVLTGTWAGQSDSLQLAWLLE